MRCVCKVLSEEKGRIFVKRELSPAILSSSSSGGVFQPQVVKSAKEASCERSAEPLEPESRQLCLEPPPLAARVARVARP